MIYVHTKTGGRYRVLADHAQIEATYGLPGSVPMVIYQSIPPEGEEPHTWIRPRYEFYDGRFQPVEDTTPVFDPIADIEQFHERFGLAYDGKPRMLTDPDLMNFRHKFMGEEAKEWREAHLELDFLLRYSPEGASARDYQQTLEKALDALVDLLYVTLGAAYLQGFLSRHIFARAWARVHEKNMLKKRVGKASDSKRGSTFDVMKPEGWTPPDHSDLIADNDWGSTR